MKRGILFALLLISFDQLLKFSFQIFFSAGEYSLFDMMRFRYVVNPGIYVKQNLSSLLLITLQLTQISAVGIVFFLFRSIKQKYKSGILLDISFGFLCTSFLGNLVIDKILTGGIRDYFVTPWGIANFADLCGIGGVLFLLLEFVFIRSRSNYSWSNKGSSML